MKMKVLLKYAIKTSGVKYLMWGGRMKMQKLFVVTLDTKMEVKLYGLCYILNFI